MGSALGLRSKATNWTPYPHQIPPAAFIAGETDTWMLLGGRGSGKTDGIAHFVRDHLLLLGPRARVGIGAPTIQSVRDVCAEGETGLITSFGREFTYRKSLLDARHELGGYVKFMGSEEPDRWNGPQWTLIWFDELALCLKESFDQAQFGLRLGQHPQTVISTTPKMKRWVKDLSENSTTSVTHGTLYEDGEEEEVHLLDLQRVVVSVDPAVTANPESDETGIGCGGLGPEGDYWVLALEGHRLPPNQWAMKAIEMYERYKADVIVAEVNNGGDMVVETIQRAAEAAGRSVNVKTIHASRGKTIRAEPIAALYEQGRVHHVGTFTEAEDQMCSFPIANEHDDLVDACVYVVSELSAAGSPNIRWLD